MLVDLAGSDVVLSSQRDVQVSLVVPQIEVNLSAIVQHKALSMFGRSHGSGIDIHVTGSSVSAGRANLFPSSYGSIFIDDTFNPIVLSSRPVDEAITPFPMPLMTPPETRTYFMMTIGEVDDYGAVLAIARRDGKREEAEDAKIRGV
jgi:hypothetical protein